MQISLKIMKLVLLFFPGYVPKPILNLEKLRKQDSWKKYVGFYLIINAWKDHNIL